MVASAGSCRFGAKAAPLMKYLDKSHYGVELSKEDRHRMILWLDCNSEFLGDELVLAGGLTPANVAEAIEIARPDLVDVSSGVESEPGVKDHRAIREFVQAARHARLRVSR